ncbi:alpha/beta fold hydrolase [Rhizobium sp. NPDC090279]|uniref:alpha/beta fold hydrolase n=1 Tax=Rhizobium sp. NPDC090279 TaxID=3364499 RepID=UPI00383B20C3
MSEIAMFRTSDGTLMNVEMSGEGPPVVFHHGLLGDANQAAEEAFPADTGFRRISIEARGHGRSEAGDPGCFSIATFADDVASYIEKQIAAPVVLGGISMGAAISLRLAVTRPNLVRALILSRPAWLTQSAPENMAPNAEVGRLLREMPLEEGKEAFLGGSIGRRLAIEGPDNLNSLLGFFSRPPHNITAALLTAISNDGPGVTDAEVRQISMPTLIIGNDRDPIHPIAYAEGLAERISGARFVKITSKAESRSQHQADFRRAMGAFLKDLKAND